ncbi:MAG: DUF167 domain-containing protein [Methylocystaceae bacterium]|nr:DUF167 domain-containing protein [Methylocystaceae bacterium]
MDQVPFGIESDGLRLFIRLTPKAKKTAINTMMTDGDGKCVLKASVTAVPEKGKANSALIKLLSKEWKLAKSNFKVISGETDRNKTLLLKGDAQALARQLKEWMKQHHD